jgi:hypothetical protein
MTSSDDMNSKGSRERIEVPIELVTGETTVKKLNLSTYPFTMSELLERRQIGRFAIEKMIVPKGTVMDGYDRQRGRYNRLSFTFDYLLTKLTEDGNTWMSDNPSEVESTMGAVEEARGDVLIGGLGIGLLPTLIKDKVTSIDIVELNQEVIELIFYQIATEKMRIIHDDVFHYLKSTDKKYDFICVDIWQDTSLPVWDILEVRKLAQRCLKPGGTTWCWLQEMYDKLR